MATDTKIQKIKDETKADVKRISHAEWFNEGKAKFGEKFEVWKFKCTNCGHVQSIESMMRHNPRVTRKEATNTVNFSCEGYLSPRYGCNWTLGGLFQIHRLEVEQEGRFLPSFEFADKDAKIEDQSFKTRKEMVKAEMTRQPIFLYQEGHYIYLQSEMTQEDIEYDFEREKPVRKREEKELGELERQQREKLGEDFDEDEFASEFASEVMSDKKLAEMGCAKVIWDTKRVFGSREEAEGYARQNAHHHFGNYLVYCVSAEGELDNLLEEKWDKFVGRDTKIDESEIKTIDFFLDVLMNRIGEKFKAGEMDESKRQEQVSAISSCRNMLQDFVAEEIKKLLVE